MKTEPIDPDDAVEEGQTLLEELAWSVALVGGVIAFLFLVVRRFGLEISDESRAGAPIRAPARDGTA